MLCAPLIPQAGKISCEFRTKNGIFFNVNSTAAVRCTDQTAAYSSTTPGNGTTRMKNLLPHQMVQEALLLLALAVLAAVISVLVQGDSLTNRFDRRPIYYTEDFSSSLPLPTIAIDSTADASAAAVAQQLPMISVEQLQTLLEKQQVTLLDARLPQEYNSGHLPGAINMPFEDWDARQQLADELPKDKWLIAYCGGPACDLAELLAWELIRQGFNQVALFPQGAEGWQKAGFPLHERENSDE